MRMLLFWLSEVTMHVQARISPPMLPHVLQVCAERALLFWLAVSLLPVPFVSTLLNGRGVCRTIRLLRALQLRSYWTSDLSKSA